MSQKESGFGKRLGKLIQDLKGIKLKDKELKKAIEAFEKLDETTQPPDRLKDEDNEGESAAN